MSDRYLWDRSGEVDREVEHLERVLSRLRPDRPLRQSRIPAWLPHVIAACLVLAATAGLFYPGAPATPETPWRVVSLQGLAALGGRTARAADKLHTNQTLRTDAASQITLEAEAVGRIDLRPATEVRVTESASARQTLNLAHGSIHVLIWAPPGLFVVDTPSARAIDLGCEYVLTAEPSGEGLLSVDFGWVAFQFGGREAFIPAGASCRTSLRRGPATPYYGDASAEFKHAVDAFDRGETGGNSEVLKDILVQARRKDAMTLWHLFARTNGDGRALVFDRFVQLVGTPAGVSRAGVIADDGAMIDRCWNALDLMTVEFWRGWKRDWTGDVGR